MSSLLIKLDFWGHQVWGQWRIWMKSALKEQKLIGFNVRRNILFVCQLHPKLSWQYLIWLENNFMKYGGCGIPDFTATPIFSANLPWHATCTHCFLPMIVWYFSCIFKKKPFKTRSYIDHLLNRCNNRKATKDHILGSRKSKKLCRVSFFERELAC